jgi:hypothetical protein
VPSAGRARRDRGAAPHARIKCRTDNTAPSAYGALGKVQGVHSRDADEVDRPVIESPPGVQPDIIDLPTQVLRAQRWPSTAQRGIGGQDPHGTESVVLAE